MKNTKLLAALLLVIILLASGCLAPENQTEEDIPSVEVEEFVDELNSPWAITFVDDGEYALVTESSGELLLVNTSNGDYERFSNVPTVDDTGQGGLLDVEVHPDYPENEWVYITYSDEDEGGLATHLGRAEMDLETVELTNFETLYVAEPFQEGGQHFGSRIVFDDDDYLFFTSGDRGDKNFDDHVSQNTSNSLGATIRLEDDGSVPVDNPFVDDEDVLDSIYSYGHRNSQGMTVHNNEVWQSEHGEEDGDEINVVEAGGNHGWPITHTGCEYGTDNPVGDNPFENPDVVNPVYYWECNTGGFPPAGMTFYSGSVFSEWEDNLFVGNLAGQYLGRFEVNGDNVEEKDPLLEDEGWRIRDVEEDPNTGYLYVVVDGSNSPIVRITPA